MLHSSVRPLTIAVLALGGQGGSVLVNWIVELAQAAGWSVQATSVAGVAQRTGATVYYLELLDPAQAAPPHPDPVFALMPTPGEVDIVIAAELMEAGRALHNGWVTPGRTTVIASSHRVYSTQEKSEPGNGLLPAGPVVVAVEQAAKRVILQDMQALADAHGSVISASLFGALAASGALPFDRAAFERAIVCMQVGVEASLRTLAASAAAVSAMGRPLQATSHDLHTAPRPLPERAATPLLQPLLERIVRDFPVAARPILAEGVHRVVEYQDPAYGTCYLDHMEALQRLDRACGGANHGHAVTLEAAPWVAVAMAYDDVIRVADLKVRAERLRRIRAEVGAGAGAVVEVEEYLHPGVAEVCGLLPRRIGHWLERATAASPWLTSWLGGARRTRTTTVLGYLQLRSLAGLRRWRRGNLRHAREMAQLQAWLALVEQTLPVNYLLALEMVRCRRVLKGYSDTMSRGRSRFDRLMQAACVLKERPMGHQDLAALRAAALEDATGAKLQSCWQTLVDPASKSPTL